MIGLIVLIILIVSIFLIKRFLDKDGKFIPSTLLMMFLKRVKDIEEKGNGRIVIRVEGDYHMIILIEDGKIVDAISVDMVGNKIYSGVVKDNKPNLGDLLIPMRIPFGSKIMEISEIRKLEDILIFGVKEIIGKYKK